MPTVLLITEQERLRLIFTRLRQTCPFRLRVAPTLAQGEEEIAVRLPHYVFVEARLAGVAGADTLRYLRGLLPEEVEVILMTQEASLSEEFRKAGGLFSLDLSLDDEALQRSITDILPRRVQQAAPDPEPSPSSEKAARELLFTGPAGTPPITRDKRLFWLTLLALAIIPLSIIAYQAGRAPQVAGPNAVAPTPQAAGTAAGQISAPTPGAPAKSGNRTGGTAAAAPSKSNAPHGQGATYTVLPGDTLLKILIKDFGFTYQDATNAVPELKRLNKMDDLTKIKPGQTLVIPPRVKPVTKATALP